MQREKSMHIKTKMQIAKGMTLSQESASPVFFACTSNLLDLGGAKDKKRVM